MVIKNISKSILLTAVFLFSCIVLSVSSEAQIAGPCAETVTKYCKDVTPGGGRIVKCLNDRRDDSSIACRDWLDDQKKSLTELNSVCTEEIVRLCNFDQPDSIRIYKCLDDNSIALKSECREKLREIKDRLQ